MYISLNFSNDLISVKGFNNIIYYSHQQMNNLELTLGKFVKLSHQAEKHLLRLRTGRSALTR